MISCEGIHSVLRKQLYPDEGSPKYSGINMWRGITRWKPFLTGASMIRVGWHHPAKLLIYPIRDNIDGGGRQLVNWVCDIETPQYHKRDWNQRGRLEDFLPAMADWHFDWLDVPQFISSADAILEYPMVDQDPLPHWSFGRLTLLGDAAHPMYPRGANGAAQAILDCRALADALKANADPVAALKAYEAKRLPATSEVVLANRKAPPDAILQEVYNRTGDKPFKHIDDVISREELVALSESYKRVAGYDKERLKAKDEARHPKLIRPRKRAVARTSGVTRFISWPLDDGALRLNITVKSQIGVVCSDSRLEKTRWQNHRAIAVWRSCCIGRLSFCCSCSSPSP